MTTITDVVSLEQRGEIAVPIVDNKPVNALSGEVRDGLSEGIERAEADPGVEAVVVVCQGRRFIAGADIRDLGKPRVGRHPTASTEAASRPLIATSMALARRIDKIPALWSACARDPSEIASSAGSRPRRTSCSSRAQFPGT